MTFLFLLIVLGGLLFVAGLVGSRSRRSNQGSVPSSLPVATKTYFFSRAEREFYETLKEALPREYVAFPNVRLQDIFQVKGRGEQERGVYARFRDKHVDFLICARQNYRPVLGIELDGSSHDRPEQQYRDAVKEVVFRSARLPLLRFRNEDRPSVPALRRLLQDQL